MSVIQSPNIEPLKEANAECWFDQTLQITVVLYGKMLSPDVTTSVYGWLARSLQTGIDHNIIARGCVFDFTQVESFYPGNITTAKSESRNLRGSEHAEIIARIPVAIIAVTDHQKMMVGISMKQSKRDTGSIDPRVRIVKSYDEALLFFEDFHKLMTAS